MCCTKIKKNMFHKIFFLTILPVVFLLDLRLVEIKSFNYDMLSTIDYSAQPCDDFYAYACGNYNENHTQGFYSDIMTNVDFQYNLLILNLLETFYNTPVRNPNFMEKTGIYFRACLREIKRNVTKYFEEIKPGLELNWPILQELDNKKNPNEQNEWPGQKDFDIWSLLGKLQSYGLNDALIYQEILIDKEGKISILLEPFADGNTLPDVNILRVLLMNLGVKKPAKIINSLHKINKKLLEILHTASENNDKAVELSYDDLDLFYPQLNLTSYLHELWGKELPADTLILLRQPSYFQYLNDHLWFTFKKQELCNYLMLKFLHYLAVDSTTEFTSLGCVRDVRKKWHLAVNFLYFRHFYFEQVNEINLDITEIFNNVTRMLHTLFQSNHLNLTRCKVNLLRKKLKQLRLNLGNLPKYFTFDQIEEFYSIPTDLDERNYYKNHLIMLKHRFAKTLSYAKNSTYFTPADNVVGISSGAYYVIDQNIIILPFASLMKPLYDAKYDYLKKYSLLSFVLAHELAHAFDTVGLNFNGEGEPAASLSNVLQEDNFQNSLQCLQSQLRTDSIDERIADIVSIQIVKNIVSEKYQPSPDWQKYFFLHLAQFFCNMNEITPLDHDSDPDRLNQIVLNVEEFAQAFQCPKGSKMNPSNKCRIY